VGAGRWQGKEVGEWLQCINCIHMYVNAKMIPVETIPEMGGRRMAEGVNSSMIYLINCTNFYKCHNVPPPSITI
jgi:hypothetical protein